MRTIKKLLRTVFYNRLFMFKGQVASSVNEIVLACPILLEKKSGLD